MHKKFNIRRLSFPRGGEYKNSIYAKPFFVFFCETSTHRWRDRQQKKNDELRLSYFQQNEYKWDYVLIYIKQMCASKLAFNRIAKNLLSGFCVTLKNRSEKKVCVHSQRLITTMNVTLDLNGQHCAGHTREANKKCAVMLEAIAHEKMECLPFCDKIHLVTDEIKSLAFRSIFVRLSVLRIFIYLQIHACCRPACQRDRVEHFLCLLFIFSARFQSSWTSLAACLFFLFVLRRIAILFEHLKCDMLREAAPSASKW